MFEQCRSGRQQGGLFVSNRCFFFAGGGTGGHIYPGIAVAEQLQKLAPSAKVQFLCSDRPIDSHILGQTNFTFTTLTAKAFSVRPGGFVNFARSFAKSYRTAKELLGGSDRPIVVGVGGFVAAPACYAGHRLGENVVLLNTDLKPGRANRLTARWAKRIFVQFDETKKYFGGVRAEVEVVGCPLRSSFDEPKAVRAIEELGLDKDKKILLVTGASSGAASINEAVCSLLGRLGDFAGDWQIVHLAGGRNLEEVKSKYTDAGIRHTVLSYYEEMADLLAAAELVIGRSGAVSVAELAATAAASILMPYPHHKDRHQYLNAEKLVEVGAAIVVDDLPDAGDRAEWLWEELCELMRDDNKREQMKAACAKAAKKAASVTIAQELLQIGE